MEYKIGDKVIHHSFGFAEVVNIEEKNIGGVSQKYYVIKTNDLHVWIPCAPPTAGKLRVPSTKHEFPGLFKILRSEYSPFAAERMSRKSQIQGMFSEGSTESLCKLIRDLSFYKMKKSLNEYENTIFERAIHILIDEWRYAFDITPSQARTDLNKLLSESYSVSAA
jgi:CarD family transcriptional regulator